MIRGKQNHNFWPTVKSVNNWLKLKIHYECKINYMFVALFSSSVKQFVH